VRLSSSDTRCSSCKPTMIVTLGDCHLSIQDLQGSVSGQLLSKGPSRSHDQDRRTQTKIVWTSSCKDRSSRNIRNVRLCNRSRTTQLFPVRTRITP
jgi:hypothetical protein